MHLLIEDCIQSKTSANLRPRYLRELRRFLLKFAAALADRPLSTVTAADVDRWLSCLKTPGGRNTAISRLGALFSFAFRRGRILENPMHRIERARQDAVAPRILSPSEAENLTLLVRERHPKMAAYVLLGLYAGIRPNELLRLEWPAIDLKRGLVRVDAAASKVRRRRFVLLEPIALQLLQPYQQTSGPVAPKQIPRRLRRLRRCMGWDKWPLDLLRHTCASYMLALHKDPQRVSLMLGNSPRILLNHYVELVSPEDCATFWACEPATVNDSPPHSSCPPV